MNRYRIKRKKNSGFTLAELLLVVALIMVVIAIAVPSILHIQKRLRQEELDRKAETVYMAVQNRLTELYTAGRADLYDPENDHYNDGSLTRLNLLPGDSAYLENAMLGEDSVYYFVKGSTCAENILSDAVLDTSLSSNYYVVEILPYTAVANADGTYHAGELTAASVYSVYYSEKIDLSKEYVSSVRGNDGLYNDTLRDQSGRMKNGARVGYYGGANMASTNTTSVLTPESVSFTNEEKLTASVTFVKPLLVSAPLVFRFDLSDEYGNTYTIKYEEKTKSFKDEDGFLYTGKAISVPTIVGRKYTFKMTLDDLTSDETRFDAQFGSKSGHNNGNNTLKRELVSGSDITLLVTVTCLDDFATAEGSMSDTSNSLYWYAKDDDPSAAFVKYGRHLQNLDLDSGVTNEITKAKQVDTIDLGSDSRWREVYTAYYNGMTEASELLSTGQNTVPVPNFEPISNPNLTELLGGGTRMPIKNLVVNAKSKKTAAADPAGLFGTVTNEITLKDLTLTGAQITSTGDAGVLLGKVDKNSRVNLENCQTYLEVNRDIPKSISLEQNADAMVFVKGRTTGGLVGENLGNLDIQKSSASTVLQGIAAGGLLGAERDSGKVTISESYADSYIYATNAGGLVGTAKKGVTIRNSYAAGFLGLSTGFSRGAGFVEGTADEITNSYTIVTCYRRADDGGIDKALGRVSTDNNIGTFYSTAEQINVLKAVYYFNGGSVPSIPLTEAVNDTSSEALQAKLSENAPDVFIIDTWGTQPYRMMGQSLSTYTYPRLAALYHFGDWEVEFESGAFVYYEEYERDGQKVYGFEADGLDSTLNSTDKLTGDGYGIALSASDSTVSEITVKVGNETVTIKPDESVYYKAYVGTGESQVEYHIYPLSRELVNPTDPEQYYTPVTISQTAMSSDGTQVESERYFLYNPHFARTVVTVTEEAQENAAEKPKEVEIRSPRHLYDLSQYYDSAYRNLIDQKALFIQERDLAYTDYDWKHYYNDSTDLVAFEQPIGQDTGTAFTHTYDGGCFRIKNVSFTTSKGNYIGMFGVNRGTIRNTVLAVDYVKNDDSRNYYIRRSAAAQANEYVYYGVLAGYSEGSIDNCAAAGYYLGGSEGTIHGYANSNIYVGGLVGRNTGKIANSEADLPRIHLSMYRSNCYAGGFVGANDGEIRNCYDLNHIEALAQDGITRIAGFAADNSGSISRSYAASALTASGTGTVSYAFTNKQSSGTTSLCYYLHAGSYRYIDGLYAYDMDTEESSGTPRTYAQLVQLNPVSSVDSQNFNNTKELSNTETKYPYRPVVKDASGAFVHYGEWQIKPDLGTVGVFYWEHETEGENQGYKITFIGTSNGSAENQYQTTLCTQHDDGGVVTEYGYGYYVLNGQESGVTYELEGLGTSGRKSGTKYTAGSYNTAAAASFAKQIAGYTFYPYTTTDTASGRADYIYKTGESANGSITLYCGTGDRYTYLINPHFANAMALDISRSTDVNKLESLKVTDNAGITTDYLYKDGKNAPGSDSNQYEIRSAAQLQYINWNSEKQNATSMLEYSDMQTTWYGARTPSYWTKFTYLGHNVGTSEGIKAGTQARYFWKQTHDVNAKMPTDNSELFTPIGSMCELGKDGASPPSKLCAAYFNGTYDGSAYNIRNVQIYSRSECVGLFGIMISADVKNLILYSDRGNSISTSAGSKYSSDTDGNRNWYCMGGLVGMAILGNSSTGGKASFTNCCVSGYRIMDIRDDCGFGGTNIGGLAGMTNVPITNSSAVCDIVLEPRYPNSSRNIRAGGLVGNFRGTVLQNCYSGGSIIPIKTNQNSNYKGETKFHVGGLVGGWFMRATGVLEGADGLFGTLTQVPHIENCYTYTDLSGAVGVSSVVSICQIAGKADINDATANMSLSNCYYYPAARISYTTAKTFSNTLNTTEVSYEELAGETPLKSGSNKNRDILTALNGNASSGAFSTVTTKDQSGAVIDGKYSFPGSKKSLLGQNYPFPTVLKQPDLTFGGTVNVHYGEWPDFGPYFEEGLAEMNIFDDIDETDGWAYHTYILKKNGGITNIHNLTFELNDTYTDEDGNEKHRYAEIAKVTDDGDVVLVKVKAMNTGAVVIDAKYEDNTVASMVLSVSADFNVTGDPKEMILENGQTEKVTLTAESVGKTTTIHTDGTIKTAEKRDLSDTEDLIFSLTASTLQSTAGDCEITKKGTDSKNTYTVKGYGYDATLTVEAKYDYHGVIFRETDLLRVRRPGIVGISNGSTTYREAKMVVEGVSDDAPSEALASDRPVTPNDYAFFLYDTESMGILTDYKDGNGVTISVTAEAGTQTFTYSDDGNASNDTLRLQWNNNVTVTAGNDYRVLALQKELRYPSDDPMAPVLQANLEVRVQKTVQNEDGTEQEVTYVLHLSDVALKPYKPVTVTLSSWVPGSDEVQTKELTKDVTTRYFTEDVLTLPACPDEFTADRYRFAGWHIQGEADDAVYQPGEKVTLQDCTAFEAVWEEIIYTVTMNANGGTITVEDEPEADAYAFRMTEDSVSIAVFTRAVKRDGYQLIGWSYTDGTGSHQITGDALNTFVIQKNQITADTTFTAEWTAYTLTLVNGSSTVLDQWNGANQKPDLLGAPGYTAPTREGWTFGGWYTANDGTGQLLVNPDGTVVKNVSGYSNHIGFLLTQDTVLYAGWSDEAGNIVFTDEASPSGDESQPEGAGTQESTSKPEAGKSESETDAEAETSGEGNK